MKEIIVVPLDGSRVGESALPYVEDLIAKMSPDVEKEIILLQVLSREQVPVPARPQVAYGATAVYDIDSIEKREEETRQHAQDYLDKTGNNLIAAGATVTTRVTFGHAAEEIVKTAEENDANLIAMSTHGRSGLSRWAFGSVTDRVLRAEGRIPIAMIRAPKKI
jgi:nucleotide-binding universal stress UspA family protein